MKFKGWESKQIEIGARQTWKDQLIQHKWENWRNIGKQVEMLRDNKLERIIAMYKANEIHKNMILNKVSRIHQIKKKNKVIMNKVVRVKLRIRINTWERVKLRASLHTKHPQLIWISPYNNDTSAYIKVLHVWML